MNSNLNSFTKFTSSSRSTEFKDIHPWSISQMITKTILISTRIVISYAMKQDILFWVCWKVNVNWNNNMIKISQWNNSHCRTNTSIRRKKETQKSRAVRVTVRNPSRKVKHLDKVIWDRKIITAFIRSISSTKIGQPVHMMNVKFSKDKYISRWVDQENLVYVTGQKIKFSVKDFFIKCDQIHKKPLIWSHLLKKSLIDNFIFLCIVLEEIELKTMHKDEQGDR